MFRIWSDSEIFSCTWGRRNNELRDEMKFKTCRSIIRALRLSNTQSVASEGPSSWRLHVAIYTSISEKQTMVIYHDCQVIMCLRSSGFCLSAFISSAALHQSATTLHSLSLSSCWQTLPGPDNLSPLICVWVLISFNILSCFIVFQLLPFWMFPLKWD